MSDFTEADVERAFAAAEEVFGKIDDGGQTRHFIQVVLNTVDYQAMRDRWAKEAALMVEHEAVKCYADAMGECAADAYRHAASLLRSGGDQ